MFDAPARAFASAYDGLQQQLFESVVQPFMFTLGLGNLLEDGFEATGWLLVGLLQIVVLVAVFMPLERLRPVEAVTDRAAVRVDVLYTLLHRLGLFRIGMFFAIEPLHDALTAEARLAGWSGWQLDSWLASIGPGFMASAVFSFVAYLVVFDFVDYWLHRGQHRLRWWWALHSLHHSQRQMTVWSDNRNHLLDDLLRDSVLVVLAQFIGVAPGQFIAIVAVTQLIESFSHANLRLSFGPFERLLVSPRFHRLHHSIGLGHESRNRAHGHNFAVLFPVWDLIFGTANFQPRFDPTGIRDQLPTHGGRDYGRGFWSQQWRGLLRTVGRA